MSLEQLYFFYVQGWELEKKRAQLLWGILGEALSNEKEEKTNSSKIKGLEEFRKMNPGEVLENGAWKISK